MRLHLQPKLRRPPGKRRTDPPHEPRHGRHGGHRRSAGGRPRPSLPWDGGGGSPTPHQSRGEPGLHHGGLRVPGSRHLPRPALSPEPSGGRRRQCRGSAQIHHPEGGRRPPRHSEHRHRHDHSQRISQDHKALRTGVRGVRGTALRKPRQGRDSGGRGGHRQTRLRAQPGRIRRHQNYGVRGQFRMRVQSRACAVEHQRHGHTVHHQHQFRRYLLQQLLQQRHAAHYSATGPGGEAHRGRRRARDGDHHRPAPAEGHPSQRRRVSFRNGPLPQTLPDKRAGQDRPHPREDGRHLQFRGGPLAGLPLAGRGIPQSSRHRRHVSGSADLGDRALGRVGVEGGGRSRRFGPSFVNLSVTGFGVVCERTNIGCDGFVGGIK
mmetsp:Transcript_5267/g.10709  ORF Transcript_5267/g.10709 Transcript_5267/m.10709 type:complete len:377 (+) Transcript_5267:1664-2794(+)